MTREEAVARIKDHIEIHRYRERNAVTIFEALNMAIKSLEQPERIRGKWIPHHDEVMLFDGISIGGVSCSECGWKTYNKMHLLFGCPYKYCPKCGADMREE